MRGHMIVITPIANHRVTEKLDENGTGFAEPGFFVGPIAYGSRGALVQDLLRKSTSAAWCLEQREWEAIKEGGAEKETQMRYEKPFRPTDTVRFRGVRCPRMGKITFVLDDGRQSRRASA
jgi:hypothetical protein